MLTLDDYERIKKNAHVRTKDEEKNDKKILDDQKENISAVAKVGNLFYLGEKTKNFGN